MAVRYRLPTPSATFTSAIFRAKMILKSVYYSVFHCFQNSPDRAVIYVINRVLKLPVLKRFCYWLIAEIFSYKEIQYNSIQLNL